VATVYKSREKKETYSKEKTTYCIFMYSELVCDIVGHILQDSCGSSACLMGLRDDAAYVADFFESW
jgi:hypothetical protein